MKNDGPISPGFQILPDLKERGTVTLFYNMGRLIPEICTGSNELPYHNHELTAILSLSCKKTADQQVNRSRII